MKYALAFLLVVFTVACGDDNPTAPTSTTQTTTTATSAPLEYDRVLGGSFTVGRTDNTNRIDIRIEDNPNAFIAVNVADFNKANFECYSYPRAGGRHKWFAEYSNSTNLNVRGQQYHSTLLKSVDTDGTIELACQVVPVGYSLPIPFTFPSGVPSPQYLKLTAGMSLTLAALPTPGGQVPDLWRLKRSSLPEPVARFNVGLSKDGQQFIYSNAPAAKLVEVIDANGILVCQGDCDAYKGQ